MGFMPMLIVDVWSPIDNHFVVAIFGGWLNCVPKCFAALISVGKFDAL